MERAEWLKQMRGMAEMMYDHFAPDYWVRFGVGAGETHSEFLQKFLELVRPSDQALQGGRLLSAACGAGRFDGMLLEAGHSVVGIDQSARMLARAREHFPEAQYLGLQYEKMGLQEMDFHEEFDGVICMDAMEHICPEDWPGIVRNFHAALKPGGPLYLTADVRGAAEIEWAYQQALAIGLPVVYGEIADEVDAAAKRALETGEVVDQCVYHFSPPATQVREWLEQAGFEIVAEGTDIDYLHIIVRKKQE